MQALAGLLPNLQAAHLKLVHLPPRHHQLCRGGSRVAKEPQCQCRCGAAERGAQMGC